MEKEALCMLSMSKNSVIYMNNVITPVQTAWFGLIQ